jgi:2-keto-4-pentenoate hydratase/2-oxohepta-3-ene-1,7-dioic acid hydratase in catechol pathway
MKLVVYGPMERLGILVDGKVVDAQATAAAYLMSQGEPRAWEMAQALVGSDLLGFIEGGDRALTTAKKAVEYGTGNGWKGMSMAWDAKNVKLLPPLVKSSTLKVMCCGGNYPDHLAGMYSRMRKTTVTEQMAREEARKDLMWGFYKLGGNIIGDGDPLIYPARTQRLDYEGEVAIVFGKKGKDIKESDYLDYVFGVTLMNDISIRDGQGKWDRQGAMTFQYGKNFDGSGIVGPCIVTKDEVKDPQNVEFWLKLNGQQRQKGNTKNMIFSFAEFTRLLSTDLVIHPGDMISGGTCAGTAADSSERDANNVAKPDLFMKVGDTVEVGSPVIGTITNKIVAK